jgi:hypothetical protein
MAGLVPAISLKWQSGQQSPERTQTDPSGFDHREVPGPIVTFGDTPRKFVSVARHWQPE